MHGKQSVHVDKSDGLEEDSVFVLVLWTLITGPVTSMEGESSCVWINGLAVRLLHCKC